MFCYFREWKYPSQGFFPPPFLWCNQSGNHPEEDQLSIWSYAWRKRCKSLEHVKLPAQNNLPGQPKWPLKIFGGVNEGRLPGLNQISLMQQHQKNFIPIKLKFFTWKLYILELKTSIPNFQSQPLNSTYSCPSYLNLYAYKTCRENQEIGFTENSSFRQTFLCLWACTKS